MGIIKEPLDADFVVDSRPLTKKEEKAISDYIRANKAKRKTSEFQRKTTTTHRRKQDA